MMKNFVLALCFISLSLSVFAQNDSDNNSRRDELEAQKVAYITSKLNLTTEEAQKFWPIYNEYRTEVDALRKERRNLRSHPGNDEDKLSDTELDALIKSRFAQERKKIDLDEKYYEKFKTALPISKIAAYYRAEHSFKRELLDRLRDQRGGGAHH